MITTRIHTQEATRQIRQFIARRTNLMPALKEFGVLMINRTMQTFDQLAYGGTYRGVTWAPFSRNYVRRPSGKKVTPQSKLLVDTGQLRASIATGIRITPKGLQLFTTKNYGAVQQKKRPFLFFEPVRDPDALRSIIVNYYRSHHG